MRSQIAKKKDEAAAGKASDLYAWAARQAALLRAGRLAEIDADAIAEEIDDVGEGKYYRLENALRILLQHLLKWEHQAAARSRSWALAIREQRRRAARQLRKNPGLKSRLEEALGDAYEDARDGAAMETGLPTRTFPEALPYSWAQVMELPAIWADEVG